MRFISSTLFILSTVFASTIGTDFAQFRRNHGSQSLSNKNLSYLWSLSDKNHFKTALDNILISRVVGTKGHEDVYNYIVDELEDLKWNVETDEFLDNTPIFGKLKFKNIIATFNPNAERFLVFACHYDSKYFPHDDFVAATDSAVPCAMLLNLAKTLAPLLEKSRNNDEVSLKLIFFDGEEAFDQWGPRDSIYGARHLAKKMAKEQSVSRSLNKQVTSLERIDLLVLLDLLGAARPVFHNFFGESKQWYELLMKNEDAFKQLGLLDRGHNYFAPSRHTLGGGIEDDHIPFLHRKVPILHLIPYPFPKEWHTPEDNGDIIDWTTVNILNAMWRTFIVQYLHLSCGESSETRQQGRPEKEL